MPKALSEAQLENYRAEGYAFPVRVMPRERALAIRAEFAAFDASDAANAVESKLHQLYRFKAHLLFAWTAEVVNNRRLLDAVEDVIGPDILLWAAGIFAKPAGTGAPIPWHQDHTYAGFDDADRSVRAWCALGPATMASGAMRYLPGSHTLGDLPHADSVAEGNLVMRGERIAVPLDETTAVPVEIDAGELTLHHLRLAHSSGPNTSDELRASLAMTFMAPEVRPLSRHDTAMLVRGRDRYGHWELETHRPRADFEPAGIAAHARAMAIRNRNFYRGAESLPPGVSFEPVEMRP